jgi:hypothetical protein
VLHGYQGTLGIGSSQNFLSMNMANIGDWFFPELLVNEYDNLTHTILSKN